MKSVFRFVFILVVCAVQLTAQTADGIYLVTDKPAKPESAQITASDGRKFYIRAKTSFDIKKSVIYSQNNENTRFYLYLTLPYDAGFSSAGLVLVAGGTAFKASGSGSSRDIESTLGFVIEGVENARQAGRQFGVEPVLRKHPENNFLVTFTPSKPEFEFGEEVLLKLRVENVGDKTIAFMKGGMNRAVRDNQYKFLATGPAGQVPDIGSNTHFGGLAYKKTLKPGEVFEDTISASKWFSFNEIGYYEIHGSYYMGFVDPQKDDYRTVWEDYVSADCRIRIVAK